MADLIIPGWFVFLMGGIGSLILAWLVYLTVRLFESDKLIAINTAHDTNVSKELKELDKKIVELKNDCKGWIDKLEVKMEKGFEKVFAKLGI